MFNFKDKNFTCDFWGLFCIGIISLGYILFVRPFAELHIQLPFMNFPVFIGEMLLFVCLCLFLSKGLSCKGKVFWSITIYLGFVIFRVLWGYVTFGPLAFRHAALFYYPLFAVLGYSFYRREFLNEKTSLFFVVFVVFLFIQGTFNSYWLFTLFVLAFILSCSCPHRIKYFLLLALFLSVPYGLLFNTSRMMMVANSVTFIYLAISFYFILQINKTIKLMISLVVICFLAAGLALFADKNALKTIVKFDKTIEVFKEYDREIEAQIALKKLSEEETTKIQVYNPDLSIGQASLIENYEASLSSIISSPVLKEEEISQNISEIPSLPEVNVKQTSASVVSDFPLPATAQLMTQKFMGKETASALTQSGFGVQSLPPGDEKEERINVQIYNPEEVPKVAGEKEAEIKESDEQRGRFDEQSHSNTKQEYRVRNLDGAYVNTVFRLFIWRDMFKELFDKKAFWGFHLGKPLRPKSLRILGWAMYEFYRPGWIEPHNSFFHIIYRTGIIGVGTIAVILTVLWRMIRKSIQCKSLTGVLLCGIILNWFVAANFLLILELPYTAIPFWALFGLTYAYIQGLVRPLTSEAKHFERNR